MANIDKYNKDSKADAKIEEKRRKNAARRAAAKAKAGADAQSNIGTQIDPPMGKSTSGSSGQRTVYRDSVNSGASGPKTGSGSAASPKRRAPKKSGRKPNFKLILILALILLLLIIRLAVFIGSTSMHHLSDEGLTHADRFAKSLVVHGIDVSTYQKDIKWKRVKSAEADFAFIRAGYRSSKTGELHEDDMFEKNMKAARKAGIMKGVYFYSQAITPEEAEEEADYLLELVKDYDIEMPLAIDFEIYEGGRLDQAIQTGEMAYASAYHDIVLAFCDRVEKAGYESCVYASYDMLTNYMDSNMIGDEATIWASQYGSKCDVEGEYMFWQCAEDAEISGIKGPVDHDIWYIEPGRVYPTKARGSKSQLSIGDVKVEFDKDTYKLKNHRAKPKVTVTSKDGKKLKAGKHYEVSFIRNETEGTGYAIIRGIGKYKDWTAVPFTIE